MNGWISLHRKITEWEWYHDASMYKLFTYLLLFANYEDKKFEGIIIKRGQILIGRKDLSKKLNISEQSVRTFIKRLKSTSEITIKSTNKYSVITICNYDSYQNNFEGANQQINQQINQQLTSNQPATNQQLTTSNKDNNNNKLNKLIIKECVTPTQKENEEMNSLKSNSTNFSEDQTANSKLNEDINRSFLWLDQKKKEERSNLKSNLTNLREDTLEDNLKVNETINLEKITQQKALKKEIKKLGSNKIQEIEEIDLFAKKEGYKIDAAHIWNYYNDNDWYDSKGSKVKNLKQKVRGVWFKEVNKITNKNLKNDNNQTRRSDRKGWSNASYYTGKVEPDEQSRESQERSSNTSVSPSPNE